VRAYTTSHSLQKMGGKLCTIIVELFIWEFLQVPTSIYLGGFYIFTMHIQGLGFKVWQIHRLTHWVRGKFCTIVVKLFTRDFLQVFTSFYINLFKWILYSTPCFQLSTSFVLLDSFLQVPTSSCINSLTCDFHIENLVYICKGYTPF